MARKRYKPEEIVSLLRQAEVLHGQGMSMADAIGQVGDSKAASPRGAVHSRRLSIDSASRTRRTNSLR